MTRSVFTFPPWRKMPWFPFGKNHLVPNSRHTFFRICLVSKLNDANWVKKVRLEFETKKKRKKVRLEFWTKTFHANHRVKESAPGVRSSHHWASNFRWLTFLTRIESLRSEPVLGLHCFKELTRVINNTC